MQRESNRQQRGCIYMGNNLSLFGKKEKISRGTFFKKGRRERERKTQITCERERERSPTFFTTRARARKRDREIKK